MLQACGSRSRRPRGRVRCAKTLARQSLTASASGSYKVLYSFQGIVQRHGWCRALRQFNNVLGVLYGTTLDGGTGCGSNGGCGTVFDVTRFGREHILYRFKGQPDGAYPVAKLLLFNGALYGTTESGGTNNDGTVFRITAPETARVIYSFKAPGLSPVGGLINVNGTFYGLTGLTIYKITPDGKESVLHTFGSGNDGYHAIGGLVNLKGTLYGATTSGGSHCQGGSYDRCGTVFSVTTDGVEHVIYSFKGMYRGDAAFPDAGLAVLDDVLYGTSYGGGKYNVGTVFAVTTSARNRCSTASTTRRRMATTPPQI